MFTVMRGVYEIPDAIRDLIADSGARIRVGYPAWLRALLRKNVIAITLGRRVYLSPRLLEEGEEHLRSIVRHELVHVKQVNRVGLVCFLLRYVREFVANRRRGLDSEAAYEAISFEVEARAAEWQDEARVAETVPDTQGTL